jgi:hypothetical protein
LGRPPAAEPDTSALVGWVPYRLIWRGSVATLDWCYLGERRFTHPFFEDTVRECLGRADGGPPRRRTSLDVLGAVAAARPSVPPSAFIFHLSRCGSTLVSRMLATLPSAIVISEAEPIDAVLRAEPADRVITAEEREAWLRSTIAVLGHRRQPEERHLFVKFDAWNVLALPLIRRAFPGVPWLFVYRDPVEVLVSHRRQPGRHAVPGVIDLGVEIEPAAASGQAALDAYAARVLARLCTAAADAYRPGEAWLLSYRDLPEAVWTSLPDVLGIELTESDVERMRLVARWHAKQPGEAFRADAAEKQATASQEIRRAAAEIRPAYARLEALRAGQITTS